MKKLIFTAITLIAFSSVSMANTISDENEVVIPIKENKKVIILKRIDCCIIYDLAYNLAISEGAPVGTAEAAANLAYNNCSR